MKRPRRIGFFLGSLTAAVTLFCTLSAADAPRTSLSEGATISQSIEAAGESSKAADAYREVGINLTSQARYEEAKAMVLKAMEIRAPLEDDGGMIQDHLALANIFFKASYYHEAGQNYSEALDLSREIDDLKGEIRSLLGLGIHSIALGYYERAEGTISAAVDRAAPESMTLYRAIGHHNLGVIYRRIEDYERAIKSFTASAEIKRSLGQSLREGLTRVTLAELFLRTGDTSQACREIDAAFRILAENDSPRDLAYATLISGDIAMDMGDSPAAAESYEKALALAREYDLPEITWRGLFRKGNRAGQAGDIPGAVSLYSASIRVIEELRDRLKLGQDKAHFLEDKIEVYEAIIQTLIGEVGGAGSYYEAFQYVERAKCHALKEILFGIQGPAEGDSESAGNRDATEWPRPMEISTVQGLLPDDGILLEYFLLPDEVLCFVISRSTFEMISKPVPRKDLHGEVERFLGMLRDGLDKEGDQRFLQSSRKLHQWLMLDAPAIAGAEARQIIVVPHSFLHTVPFCALHNGDQWLVERYVLSTVPSSSESFLTGRRDRRPQDQSQNQSKDQPQDQLNVQKVLFVHNSRDDLSYSERERRIVQWYHPSLSSTEKEGEFKEKAGDFDVIHIATHGRLYPSDPMATYLSLLPDRSDDGHLTVKEIARMKLRSDLVVLSACSSGVGKVLKGDDVIGLMGAFLSTGSASVLATLWDIDDGAASTFMRLYYHYLQETDSARALRMAQLDLIGGKRVGVKGYGDPFCWAPFFLSGSIY